MGTYLTTMHKQGVALWGGKSWERIVRFAHPNVKLIDFSPKENYLITWSVESASDKDDVCNLFSLPLTKSLESAYLGHSHR
jgi:translation initiation factor 3 subunit B